MWQAIESAPKDGTKVVLFGTLPNDDRPRACVSWWCRTVNDGPAYTVGWFFSVPGFCSNFVPTHWQALPEPPKEEE